MSSTGKWREDYVAYWCSREESVVLFCKAGEFMGRVGGGRKGMST